MEKFLLNIWQKNPFWDVVFLSQQMCLQIMTYRNRMYKLLLYFTANANLSYKKWCFIYIGNWIKSFWYVFLEFISGKVLNLILLFSIKWILESTPKVLSSNFKFSLNSELQNLSIALPNKVMFLQIMTHVKRVCFLSNLTKKIITAIKYFFMYLTWNLSL